MIKWANRLLVGVLIIAAGLLGFVAWSSLAPARPVGFQLVQAVGKDGQAIVIAVWYPTEARAWPTRLGPMFMTVARDAPISGRALPLIVLSHGNGGGPLSHADLALALASAGYIVAAPMHNGDNTHDQSAVGSPDFFNARPRELRATVDHMLAKWAGSEYIDAQRVGAYGFSMGGFGVLSAIGVQPQLGMIAAHCARQREFACDVLRHFKSPWLQPDTRALQAAFRPDPRIKAAVVAAPGFGFTMPAHAPGNPGVPIQLWNAQHDDHVGNTETVRAALGPLVEVHSVPRAGHFSFLVPCSGLMSLMPGLEICKDAGQFDRTAFHRSMNASLIAFFDKHLKKPAR
jgi:predicted dienelactone hydrolase